jgi:hypothetical protein
MDSEDSGSAPCWENIPFSDLTICETIGGGGVALVYRGLYRKNSVALKTLVQRAPHVSPLLLVSTLIRAFPCCGKV